MTKEVKGMKNPINKGGLQRVFGVLVVLLIASVLLIGAASADDGTSTEKIFYLTAENASSTSLNTVLTQGYTIVILTDTITKNLETNSGYSGDITIKAVNGAVLNGYVSINHNGNATIKDMAIHAVGPVNDGWGNNYRAISMSGNAKGIVVDNTTFTFENSITAGKQALQITTGQDIVELCFTNNIIENVTHNVIQAQGVNISSDITITVSGNTVSANPNEAIAPANGLDNGRGLLKIHYNKLDGNVIYNVYDNTIVKVDGAVNNYNAIRIDGVSPEQLGKMDLNMWNNTLYSISGDTNNWADMLGGYNTEKTALIYGHQLGSMIVWETEKNGNLVLAPGLNMTNVEWDGNTVNISKADDYVTKTTDEITLTSDTVAGVKINGNEINKATLTIDGKTSVENVTTGDTNTGELTAKVSATDGLKREVVWSVKSGGENITLETTTGEKATYKAKKVGTATIKAEIAGGVYKEIAVTVFGEAKAETDATIETVDDEGNVTISTTSGNDKLVLDDGTVIDSSTQATTVDAGESVTLATESGVNVSLTYGEGATITSGEVNGKVTKIEATYPQTTAASENVEGVVSYGLVLTLKTEALNGSLILPTISPEFNETVSKKIDTALYTALSMITATANVGEINGNLTNGGIEITFIIPKKAVTEKNKIRVLHVDGENPPSEVSISTPTEDGKGNWIVKAQGSTFSSYVLAEYVYVAKDTGSSSSSSSGSSVWLQEPVTPTEQPTPTETATPTDTVPTDIPVTQPTSEPSSPGFGILAALAGLGAVAVLRRK